MKKNLFKVIITVIITIILLSMTITPVMAKTGNTSDSYLNDADIIEEVKWEGAYDTGDLPLNELQNAVLKNNDVPDIIGVDMANKNNHVNRLYAQEPDDYTIMFQNRDGSKTVYLFSFPIKSDGKDLSLNKIQNSVSKTTPAFTVSDKSISFTSSMSFINRLCNDSDKKPLYSYNIGRALIQYIGNENSTKYAEYDITDDVREFATNNDERISISADLSENASSSFNIANTSSSTLVMFTITWSDFAGLNAIKNNNTNKYFTYLPISGGVFSMHTALYQVYGMWLFSYEYDNDYYYSISPAVDQSKYLAYNSTYSGFTISSTKNYYSAWILSAIDWDDMWILPYYGDYAMNSTPGFEYSSSAQFSTACDWSLTNHTPALTDLTIPNVLYTQGWESLSGIETTNPSTALTFDLRWYIINDDGTSSLLPYEDDTYCIDSYGINEIYCVDESNGITSNIMTVINSDFDYLNNRITYAIRPYYATNLYLTRRNSAGTPGIATVTNCANGDTFGTYKKIDTYSQLFILNYLSESQRYTIASTLNTSQYNNSSSSINTNVSANAIENMGNYLKVSPGSVYSLSFDTVNSSNNNWSLINVTGSYYLIVSGLYTSGTGNKIMALRYTATGLLTVDEYDEDDSSFLWQIDRIGLNTPLIVQTENNYCGPATVLQAIYGAGLGDSVSGSTVSNKMDTLALLLNTNNTGTERWLIDDYINSYSVFVNNTQKRYYVEYIDDSAVYPISKSTMCTYIATSLSNNWSPFALITVGGAPYMIENGGHFISIIGYDSINDLVYISNCHNNLNYSGVYVVTAADLYSDGFLLYSCR